MTDAITFQKIYISFTNTLCMCDTLLPMAEEADLVPQYVSGRYNKLN
jgi:hypothetical protein